MQKNTFHSKFQCKPFHSFRYANVNCLGKRMNPAWVGGAVLMFLLNSIIFSGTAHSANNTRPLSLDQGMIQFYSDTINKPELVKAIYLLTAENGKAIGPNIKYMSEWRAFGWFTSADKVEWQVEVAKASQYEVRIEWSVSDKEAGKQFLLQAGDKKLIGTVDRSGSWTTFKSKSVGKIYLRAGRQKIIFRSNKSLDDGALLDLRSISLIPL